MNMILAYRFKSKLRWLFWIIGGGLIFSTIYMRYHYGVDLLAGIFFAIFSLWFEPKLRIIFYKLKNKIA
jgi:membrane-associated phospholipid phosphatase